MEKSVVVQCSTRNDVEGLRKGMSWFKLRNEFKRTFNCLVCNDAASPPVSLSKCCKQILGCASCIEAWRVSEGSEGTCPNCRADEESF